MTSLAERLKAKNAAAREKAQVAYRALVRQTAEAERGGKGDPDPDDIAPILDAAGADVDKFAADVAVMVTRFALAEQVAAEPAHQRELEAARAALAKAEEEFAKLEERHRERTAPIRDRIARAQQGAAAAYEARDRLFKECPHTHLRDQLTRATAAVEEAGRQRDAAAATLDRARQNLSQLTDAAEGDTKGMTATKEQVRDAQASFDLRRAELAEAVAAYDRAIAARDQAEEAMRAP